MNRSKVIVIDLVWKETWVIWYSIQLLKLHTCIILLKKQKLIQSKFYLDKKVIYNEDKTCLVYKKSSGFLRLGLSIRQCIFPCHYSVHK